MPVRVLAYTLIMVLLWGSHAGVAAKTMAGGADALSRHGLLFFKLLFADVCLFALIAATGRLRVLRGYSWARIARLAFAGVFGFFLYYVCYFWAIERAMQVGCPVAEPAIINYLFPMATLFASAALAGDRLTRRSLVAAVVAFAGAWVVVSRGDLSQFTFANPAVDLLAVAAAASWGVFSALGRRWRHEPLTGMFVFITTGLVLSGLILPFTAGRKLPAGWEIYGCFHVGFLCNTLGTVLWFLALRHGGASLAGNLSLLASFVSLVVIRLLMPDQAIPLTAVAGLTLIISGVLLSRKPSPSAEPPPDAPDPAG